MSAFAKLRQVTASFGKSVLLPLSKNSAVAGRIFIIFSVGHLLIGRDNLLILESEKNNGQFA
jgi:hypothetical protein